MTPLAVMIPNHTLIMELYVQDSDFHKYVYDYAKSKGMFVNYALIEKPVIRYANQIMRRN